MSNIIVGKCRECGSALVELDESKKVICCNEHCGTDQNTARAGVTCTALVGPLEAALRRLKRAAAMYATAKRLTAAWDEPITRPCIERETEETREELLQAAESYFEAAVSLGPTKA